MEFRILGPLEVRHGGEVLSVGGSKRRGVLAFLLVSAPTPQSLDAIIEAVWADSGTRGATGTVQTYVSQLRKVLAADATVRIETMPSGYALVMPPDRLDADRMETLVATASATSDPEDRLRALDEALGLYRSTPLAEFDTAWADAERSRLEALRIRALGMCIDVRLDRGDHASLIGELEALVRELPLDERMWARLMLAYHGCGRQADALRAFTDARKVLATELGIEPGRELVELERRILAGDIGPQRSPTTTIALPEGVVTFLLTDIEGSTALWDSARDAMSDALARHERIVSETVREYLGVLLKMRGEGDATMSVFRNATDAVGAALALQRRLLGEAWADEVQLSTRIALHSGEAQLRDGDYYGGTLNRAARIRGLAAGGEVLCSRATHDLVADNLPEGASVVRWGEHALKGLQRPEEVFALEHPDLPAARPPPRPRMASARRVFIARAREVETIVRAAAEVATGRAQVLLISGEAGIGKSTLVEHVAQLPEFAALDVVWGRCYEHEGAPPFWPWLQVLRAARSSGSLAERAAELGRDVPVLAQLLPELSDQASASASLPELDRDAARFRLFEAVARLIRRAAGQRPLMLVLDDIHWADHASLLLFEFVARQLTDAPVLLVATYRTPDVFSRRSVADAIGDLVRLPATSSLALTGFDVDEVGHYVERCADAQVSGELARTLYERTDGNPFFLAETVRLVQTPDGDLDAAELIARMPESIRAAISRRVNRLPDDSRAVVEAAAVIGRDFDERALSEVAATSAGEIAAHVALAQRAGLTLEVTTSRVPRHRFVHALVRDAVYEDLPLDRRRNLHALVGEALERVHHEHLDEHLENIAHHFVDAVPTYDPARALEWCRAAGIRALDLYAYENAQALFATATELLPLVETQEAGLELDLTLRQAEALERAGREPAAQQVYLRAVELARQARDGERLAAALVGLAQTYYFSSPGSGGASARDALYEEALAAISSEDSASRARLLATFAEAQAFDRPLAVRQAVADEALAMARRIGDDTTLSFVASCWYAAVANPANFPDCLTLAQEMVELAERIADRRYELWAAQLQHALSVEGAQRAATASALNRMKEVEALLNSSRARWEVLRTECVELTLTGAFEQAEAVSVRAIRVVESGNSSGETETFVSQIGVLRFLQGRFEELLEPLRRFVDSSPLAYAWESALVATLAELGDEDQARDRLERLVPEREGLERLPSNMNSLFVLATLAIASHLLDDQLRARWVYGELRPYEDRMVTMGGLISVLGPVAYYLGLAALCVGGHDDAIAHFEHALEIARRVDGRPFVAMAQAGCAEALVARNGHGDLDRAAELADAARLVADEIGMDRVRERAERICARAEEHRSIADARRRFGAPADAFIGREPELATLAESLARPGLVTIVGTGGVGKTRLAQEAAARTSLGVERSWFVALAGLADDDGVALALEAEIAPSPGDANAVSTSATAGPLERTAEAIGRRQALLVVDNCEHVRGAVIAATQRLIGLCPNLTVLATSRERLSLPAERLVALPPLSIAEPDGSEGDSEAMRLLQERARAGSAFSVHIDDTAALVEICRLVDGIPLALELAAARLTSTSARDLLPRMTGLLELLRGEEPREERHRTVDAAIDWSYQLLEPSAQTLLRRLAVFRGGFTLDAAEQVCRDEYPGALPDDTAVHLALSELVTKSLVVFDRDAERYRLLEPIRLFARRRLEAPREFAAVADAHLQWVRALGRELRRAQFGQNLSAMSRAVVEFDNIEAAVVWCDVTGDDTALLKMIGDIAGCWFSAEWRRGLRLARIATDRERNTTRALRAYALLARGRLEQRENMEASISVLRECLSLHRELEDRAGEALSLFFLGRSIAALDADESRDVLEDAVSAFRELHQPVGVAWSLTVLGSVMLAEGRSLEGVGRLEEAATIARDNDIPTVLGTALAEIGMVELRAEHVDRACALLREGIAVLRTTGDMFNLGGALCDAAQAELLAGNLDDAEQLASEAADVALEFDDEGQLCHALVALAAVNLERGDTRRARMLAAATGWDLAPPPLLPGSSTWRTVLDLEERAIPGLEEAAEEGRRLGPEQAARVYLARD